MFIEVRENYILKYCQLFTWDQCCQPSHFVVIFSKDLGLSSDFFLNSECQQTFSSATWDFYRLCHENVHLSDTSEQANNDM